MSSAGVGTGARICSVAALASQESPETDVMVARISRARAGGHFGGLAFFGRAQRVEVGGWRVGGAPGRFRWSQAMCGGMVCERGEKKIRKRRMRFF